MQKTLMRELLAKIPIVYSKDVNFDGVIIYLQYIKKREYNYGFIESKNYNISNFLLEGLKIKDLVLP